jgi:hypothetical protein
LQNVNTGDHEKKFAERKCKNFERLDYKKFSSQSVAFSFVPNLVDAGDYADVVADV